MKLAGSLRLRLMILILLPLIVIACLLGYGRYTSALKTAEELFDRTLLAAPLAISRDVTVSGGDALSVTTRDLIAEAAGGQVFYHVTGPDRAYITGYGYPPVPPPGLPDLANSPQFYVSVYREEAVRALRLIEQTQAAPLQGLATVTVWQRQSERRDFARSLAAEAAVLLATLLVALAVVIWFGVNLGLRPLLDLESAIAARTSDDLNQIRRRVPKEVAGIVSTLNALFGQVQTAMQARDVFISNAAHQLRNPVAGILALSEAAAAATSDAERIERIADVRAAAERTARLTTQMLALERIKGAPADTHAHLDLNGVAETVATRNAERVLGADIAFEFHAAPGGAVISGDAVMLEEAVENLIDNALAHGGAGLSCIDVSVRVNGQSAILSVADDGRGLSPKDAATAIARFSQVEPSAGSGLGLAIVEEIARMHGAKLSVDDVDTGTQISLTFQRAA
jgi:two-component system sensor histidine kinase TctE